MRAFDGRKSDTGWVSVTLASGTGYAQYRVIGKTVHFKVSVTLASYAAGADVTVVAAGGIPAAYCPASSVYDASFYGNVVGYVLVHSDGSVTAHASTGSMAAALFAKSWPMG